MKKLLGLLAATGLVASTGATVVACGGPAETNNKEITLSVASLTDDTNKVTISEFVEGQEVEITSNAEASILTTEASAVNEEVLESTITISITEENLKALTEDATEVLTVSYNEVELLKITVSITAPTVIETDVTDNEISVNVDEEGTITVTGTPAGLAAVSSDEEVFTVEQEGSTFTIKGVAAGTAELTISATNAFDVVINVTVV